MRVCVFVAVFLSSSLSGAMSCSQELEGINFLQVPGGYVMTYTLRSDIESRSAALLEEPEAVKNQKRFLSKVYREVRGAFTGLLQGEWIPDMRFYVDEQFENRRLTEVYVDVEAQSISLSWGAGTALSRYPQYLAAHEFTHALIGRRLWEIEPEFQNLERWAESAAGSQTLENLEAKEKKMETPLTLDETFILQRWRLFRLTRSAYEEIIADIAPLLVYAGSAEVFDWAMSEVLALEDALYSPLDAFLHDPGKFAVRARNMAIVLSAEEIVDGIHGDADAWVDLAPHEIIANARSRVWRHIVSPRNTLSATQVMEVLIRTLEAEVTHQMNEGFYLPSHRGKDAQAAHIRRLNDQFVQRFEGLMSQAQRVQDLSIQRNRGGL